MVLLDTYLVSSYMQCNPPRHSALVRSECPLLLVCTRLKNGLVWGVLSSVALGRPAGKPLQQKARRNRNALTRFYN